jgi:hypothetical protein
VNLWQRIVVTGILTVEIAITALPSSRTFTEPGTGNFQRLGPYQGILLSTCTILLITAAAALVTTWLKPRARSWPITFAAAHAAAVALGWAHHLPILMVVALLSGIGVPALVLLPGERGE